MTISNYRRGYLSERQQVSASRSSLCMQLQCYMSTWKTSGSLNCMMSKRWDVKKVVKVSTLQTYRRACASRSVIFIILYAAMVKILSLGVTWLAYKFGFFFVCATQNKLSRGFFAERSARKKPLDNLCWVAQTKKETKLVSKSSNI